MKMFIRRNLLIRLAVIVLSLILLAACGKSSKKEAKTAKLDYVNWVEGVDYTTLAKVVLEKKMDYQVEITSADVGPAYTAVAKGDMDAFMESWLPVLQKDYWDQYKADLVDLGVVYEGTQSGLVVPSYVTIDSISQLNSVKDKFGGKIIGIDAGAGIMKTTAQAIKEYNLDYKLLPSSGPAMTAALKKAIENNEWIVVTGWRPHWMFGRFELKFLKQSPSKTIWEKGDIHILGRKNIRQDKPELAQFLSNMFFTHEQLADLMVKVKESDQDIETVVTEWMNNHPDVINAWIPESAKKKM